MANTLLQWRCRINNAHRMASASLLADVDTELRSVARGVDPYARGGERIVQW